MARQKADQEKFEAVKLLAKSRKSRKDQMKERLESEI